MNCKNTTPLEKQIAEAKAAYHSLMTGTAVVEVVDQNGERVRFNPAKKSDLYAYIMSLENQLPCSQLPLCAPKGPAGFFF